MTDGTKLRLGITGGIAGGGAGRDQSLEKIRLADQLGYDSIWFGETWGYDMVTSMGDVVRATEKIKVGSGIMNVYSRSPGVIASTFATLDERSGGRMLIGLGSSGANVIEHFHGVPFEKPMRRLREYVEVINMLLHGERLSTMARSSTWTAAFGFRYRSSATTFPSTSPPLLPPASSRPARSPTG